MSRDDDLIADIETGNGFDRNQAATTNHMLRKSVVETRDLKVVTSNLLKLQRGTINTLDKLITIITSLDSKNEKLQMRVYILSILTGILALAQLVVAVTQ